VGDEDDGPLAPSLAPDDVDDPLGQVGRQGRRHLVEEEDDGFRRQGPGQVEDPERRERELPGEGMKVEIGDPELAHPGQERLEGRVGEGEVGRHVEIGDEGRLLVDRDEAGPTRLGRRADGPLLAAHDEAPGVGPNGPGQDLDEGALAGTVRAEEGVDLARPNSQGSPAQGGDGAVVLGDAGRFEEQIGHGTRRAVVGSVGAIDLVWNGGCRISAPSVGTFVGRG